MVEKMPSPESEEWISTVWRIEAGKLTEVEKDSLKGLVSKQERYGLHLHFVDNSGGRPMDFWDNYFNVESDLEKELNNLNSVAFRVAYDKLPESKKAVYEKLRSGKPEELEKEGLGDLSPEDILPTSNVDEMDRKELKEVLDRADFEKAEYWLHNYDYDPITGEKMPDKEEDKKAYEQALKKTFEYLKEDRAARRDAAVLQMKNNVYVCEGADLEGKSYLEKVEKKLR